MKYRKFLSNIKQRTYYYKTEIFQKVLRTLFFYSQDTYFKLVIQKKIHTVLLYNYFKTYIKNYCIISGRSRSILFKFKVSRIVFRILGNRGLFFGLQKTSW